MKNIFLLTGLAILLTSCATPIANYKLLIKDDIAEIKPFLKGIAGLEQVKVSECSRYLVTPVFFSWRTMLKNPVDAVVNGQIVRTNPDVAAIQDLQIKYSGVTTLFYNQYCYQVAGQPVALKRFEK